MKKNYFGLIVFFFVVVLYSGCSDDSTSGSGSNIPTYAVTATVLNPQGQKQGGALLSLKNPPFQDPKFSAYTDSSGKATIQAPEGNQILLAKIGSAFASEISVNVKPLASGTIADTLRLVQNTAVKVLVVKASAEQLENVLRVIGYSTFDSMQVSSLRDSVRIDSTRALELLKKYTLIFSNCDAGSEDYYPVLSRVIGRYVQQGGKVYGGHYNYYNLRKVWIPNFTIYDTQNKRPNDSISIIDIELQNFLGFSTAKWNSSDSRALSGYDKFSDLPTTSKIYGTIYGTSPAVGVIVENYLGSGKYLWTDYHNQDIKSDPKLVKIVQYFLLTL